MVALHEVGHERVGTVADAAGHRPVATVTLDRRLSRVPGLRCSVEVG
jgi:hypothetical protein